MQLLPVVDISMIALLDNCIADTSGSPSNKKRQSVAHEDRPPKNKKKDNEGDAPVRMSTH